MVFLEVMWNFLFNFIGYSLYLHFKCYTISPPLPSLLPLYLLPWRCSLSQSPVPPQCLGCWRCSSHEVANLSALSVLSVALSLGSPCSVWCLVASILICICMTLAEPLRRHSCLVPASKHFLASAIVLGFGCCIYGGSPGGAVSVDLFFSPCSII